MTFGKMPSCFSGLGSLISKIKGLDSNIMLKNSCSSKYCKESSCFKKTFVLIYKYNILFKNREKYKEEIQVLLAAVARGEFTFDQVGLEF